MLPGSILRRHWRRTLAAILFVVLIGLWCVWFGIAHRRLTFAITSFQSANETLDRSKLVWRAQPTTLPAGNFLHQAMAAMSTTQLPPSLTDLGTENVPFSDKWYAAAEQAIRANGATLSLARKARGFQESPWTFNDFNPARALSALLGDAAIYAHHVGNDNESIQRILDIRHLAWCMNRDPGSLSPVVAIGIEFEANSALHEIIAVPRARGGRGPLPSEPAYRKVLERLIPELLDDAPLRARVRFELRGNVIYEYRVLELNIHGTTVLRPMAELDAASILEDRMKDLSAITKPTYPAALAEGPSNHAFQFIRPEEAPPPNYAHVVRSAFNSPSPLIQIQFQVIARRRLLATDIAAELYFVDHRHWPASLTDLVPRYLPAVPIDPFAAHGEPISYAVLTDHGIPRPVLGLRRPPGTNSPELPPERAQFDYGIDSAENRWMDLTIPDSKPTTEPTIKNK